jgi:hypothetical protein
LLHDNNEDGGKQAEQLSDFIQEGFLSYFTVDGEAQQLPVYQYCATRSGQQYAWIAAIDIDEFLVVEDTRAKQLDPAKSLKAVLKDFRFQPGLWLQWRGFGPGNHKHRPAPGGPLAHYTNCMPLKWPPEKLGELRTRGFQQEAMQALQIVKYGKTIANTFWVEHASTAHGFIYKLHPSPFPHLFPFTLPQCAMLRVLSCLQRVNAENQYIVISTLWALNLPLGRNL